MMMMMRSHVKKYALCEDESIHTPLIGVDLLSVTGKNSHFELPLPGISPLSSKSRLF